MNWSKNLGAALFSLLLVLSTAAAQPSRVFRGDLSDLGISLANEASSPYTRADRLRRSLSFARTGPGNFLVAAVEQSGKISIISIPDFKTVAAVPPPGRAPHDIAFGPGGKQLAVATGDARVAVYDPRSAELLKTPWEGYHPDRPWPYWERGGFKEYAYFCEFSARGALRFGVEHGVAISEGDLTRSVDPTRVEIHRLRRPSWMIYDPWPPNLHLCMSDQSESRSGPQSSFLVHEAVFSPSGRSFIVRKNGFASLIPIRNHRPQVWDNTPQKIRLGTPRFEVFWTTQEKTARCSVHEERWGGTAAALTSDDNHAVIANDADNVEVWSLNPLDHFWDVECQGVRRLFGLSADNVVAIDQGSQGIVFFSIDLLDTVHVIRSSSERVYQDTSCRFLLLREGHEISIIDTKNLSN